MADRTVPNWLRGALLLVLPVIAYAPALHGGFLWDDGPYLADNETLRSLAGLARIWFEPYAIPHQYYPMVHTSYWLEYRVFGLETFGYHVVNALLHGLGAWLAWRVLARLRVPGAWFAGALFALHPVEVESVAWLTERKNVLSGLLALASLLAYLRWTGLPDGPRSGRIAYVAAFVAFVASLLAKSVTCVLPAVILLLVWWKRGRVRRRDVLPLVPFLAVGLALGLLTAWMERSHVGAVGDTWNLSPAERVLVAGRALWFYATKLVWPAELTFIYPRWTIDAGAPLQYAWPLGALAAIVVLWRIRDRIGRGPLVGVLCFGGVLVPALGFFDVYFFRYAWVQDHFQYHASIVGLALLAAGATRLAGRMHWPGAARALAALAVLALLGSLTWRQARVYASSETLWRDTLAKNPDAWMAHNNLASLLREEGRFDEAEGHYRRAAELRPGYAKPLNNLGVMLQGLGRLPEAEAVYREALAAEPDDGMAHYNLAGVLQASGRIDEALEHLRSAAAAMPDNVAVLANLARMLAAHPRHDARRPDEALRLAERAVELSAGDDAMALDALAAAHAAHGDLAGALEASERGLEVARTRGPQALAGPLEARVLALRRALGR